MKRCIIFSAGTFFGLRQRPVPDDFVIAADAGYLACLVAGVTPDLLLGDFDSMEQPVDLDDAIAQTVLPYGLAAHLLLGENDQMAAFFFQRYAELLRGIGFRRGAVWEDIQT